MPRKSLLKNGSHKNKFNLNTRLRQAIRKVWLRSPQRYDVLKQAKVRRGAYECALCHGEFKMRDLQVDHNPAIGKIEYLDNSMADWNGFVYKLFMGEMRALCVECHYRCTHV